MRVDERAALKSRNDTGDFYVARGAVDADLHARRNISQLFVSACDAKALARRRLRISPTELLSRGGKDGAQAVVCQILQAELERIHLDLVSEFVHEGFAREMIRGGGERAIRALTERRIHLMKLEALIRDVVESLNSSGAGIVVVKLPCRNCAVVAHAA